MLHIPQGQQLQSRTKRIRNIYSLTMSVAWVSCAIVRQLPGFLAQTKESCKHRFSQIGLASKTPIISSVVQ